MRPSAQLLTAAADALDHGEDPFNTDFLSRHDVTADQCASMAQQLALGAKIVAHAVEHPRSAEGVALIQTLARV